jgi:hypothetical protein
MESSVSVAAMLVSIQVAESEHHPKDEMAQSERHSRRFPESTPVPSGFGVAAETNICGIL